MYLLVVQEKLLINKIGYLNERVGTGDKKGEGGWVDVMMGACLFSECSFCMVLSLKIMVIFHIFKKFK